MKIINPPNIKVQQGISEKLDNLKIPYDNYLRLKKDLVIKYSMLKNSILEYEFSMNDIKDNESQIRKDKIDPHLKETGWESKDGIKAYTEFPINKGQIQLGGSYGERKKVDYLLTKNGAYLGIIEAKSTEETYQEGIPQAKEYAKILDIRFTYASDGIIITKLTWRLVMKS